ncbi:MAG: hypothetical protein MJ189_05800 [Coriobacteriales bacterium]|nr:hypothetical protein [Coriobacteriales bacterium]
MNKFNKNEYLSITKFAEEVGLKRASIHRHMNQNHNNINAYVVKHNNRRYIRKEAKKLYNTDFLNKGSAKDTIEFLMEESPLMKLLSELNNNTMALREAITELNALLENKDTK